MEFMNSMFGDNTAPMQQTALPADDAAMQLELKRRLKMAEALQQQALPEGQMVSGHYVAPSFTQYLANAYGKYQGGKQEREALGQFGEYQKSKQAKYANLLNELGQGKEVTEPMDYNEAGNMPGMEQTTRKPFSQQEFMTKVGGVMPDLVPKMLEAQIAQYTKENVPVNVAKGGSLVDPKTGKVIYQAPSSDISDFAKVDIDKFDPQSVAKFAQTKNYADLLPIGKPDVLKAPPFRTIMQGGNEIQQELQKDGTWKEVGRGARFKPEAPVDKTSVENTASMIASGQIQPLSGFAMKTPWGQQVMSRVKDMNPDFSGASFGNQKKAVQDFNTGKLGSTVRSLNVATSHLDTLGGLADALGTGNVQLLNKAANAWKSQTGQVAPVNFDAAKKIVADEVVKAVVGSGGGVADREEAAQTIQSANSPAQLRGVINTYKDLMHGQLNGLRQQYEQSTNLKDFDKYLSPSIKPQSAPSAARSQADAILGL